MVRKIGKWIVDGVNRETPLNAKRGTLREAVENLVALGINREDRRRFIEKYNLKTVSNELLDFGSKFNHPKIYNSEKIALDLLYLIASTNRNFPYSEDMVVTLDDVPKLYDKIVKGPVIIISL